MGLSDEINALLGKICANFEAIQKATTVEKLEASLDDVEKKESLMTPLKSLYRANEELVHRLSQAAADRGQTVPGVDSKKWACYESIVHPVMPTIERAYYKAYNPVLHWMINLLSEVPEQATTYNPSIQSGKDTLSLALDYLDTAIEEDDYRRDEVFAFDKAWEIIEAPYFQPDQWLQNAELLKPAVITGRKVNFPRSIRSRLKDAYLSFVFGNWTATVSLCRSVLEYAILDRASEWRIDVMDEENPNKNADLSTLIKRTSRKLQSDDGESDMDYIRRWGNAVMHPHMNEKVAEMPTARQIAGKCIEHLRRSLELLYRGDA